MKQLCKNIDEKHDVYIGVSKMGACLYRHVVVDVVAPMPCVFWLKPSLDHFIFFLLKNKYIKDLLTGI